MRTSSSLLRLLLLAFVTVPLVAATPVLTAQDKPMSADVKKYLQQLINGLRQFRVGRDEVNWREVESKTMAAAAGAQTIPEAFPAIRVALTEIRDPWAMYRSASGESVGLDGPRCQRTNSTTPNVPNDVGYLKVVPVASRGVRSEREAAVATRSAIKAGDDRGAVNWIIDLRGHFMGALPAAVMGLAPLMGDGTAFKMQYADVAVPFVATQSSIKADGQEMQMDLGRFALSRKKFRVAVLVDGGTAGVGELLAIAFEGRTDARIFGQPTCGIPPLRLVPQPLKDGAVFTVSAMRIIDRNDKAYLGPIQPHERIDEEARLFERVIAWLAGGQ
jgi:carboxyl-terminal processing protease